MPSYYGAGPNNDTTLGWDGSSKNTGSYTTAYLEVTTYNTPITVNVGVGAANPVQVMKMLDLSSSPTITGTGLYSVPAIGNISLTGLGSGVVNLIFNL